MNDTHQLSGWWSDETWPRGDGEDGEFLVQWSLADFPELVPAERVQS